MTRNRSRFIIVAWFLIHSAVLLQFAGVVGEAAAGDWMFRRSYFSHAIPQDQQHHYPRPVSRSAYRRAVVGAGPGFSVRGGYRINRIYLNSGSSSDVTVLREDFFRFRP